MTHRLGSTALMTEKIANARCIYALIGKKDTVLSVFPSNYLFSLLIGSQVVFDGTCWSETSTPASHCLYQ
jgi:hypothetical protein